MRSKYNNANSYLTTTFSLPLPSSLLKLPNERYISSPTEKLKVFGGANNGAHTIFEKFPTVKPKLRKYYLAYWVPIHREVGKRLCGPVVRALALRSGDPGFKRRCDHWLNLILGSPWFNFSAALVSSQVACLPASWDS